jgi:hypothetical protein
MLIDSINLNLSNGITEFLASLNIVPSDKIAEEILKKVGIRSLKKFVEKKPWKELKEKVSIFIKNSKLVDLLDAKISILEAFHNECILYDDSSSISSSSQNSSTNNNDVCEEVKDGAVKSHSTAAITTTQGYANTNAPSTIGNHHVCNGESEEKNAVEADRYTTMIGAQQGQEYSVNTMLRNSHFNDIIIGVEGRTGYNTVAIEHEIHVEAEFNENCLIS